MQDDGHKPNSIGLLIMCDKMCRGKGGKKQIQKKMSENDQIPVNDEDQTIKIKKHSRVMKLIEEDQTVCEQEEFPFYGKSRKGKK